MVRESEIMQAGVKPGSRADGKGAFAALTPAIWDVILLSVVWIGSVVLVNPAGQLPAQRRLGFGTPFGGFSSSGEYSGPARWGRMTLISQAVWGGLFCLPAGFSFTALRFSTLAWR